MNAFSCRQSSEYKHVCSEIRVIQQAAVGKNIQAVQVPHPGFAVGIETQFWELIKRRYACVTSQMSYKNLNGTIQLD